MLPRKGVRSKSPNWGGSATPFKGSNAKYAFWARRYLRFGLVALEDPPGVPICYRYPDAFVQPCGDKVCWAIDWLAPKQATPAGRPCSLLGQMAAADGRCQFCGGHVSAMLGAYTRMLFVLLRIGWWQLSPVAHENALSLPTTRADENSLSAALESEGGSISPITIERTSTNILEQRRRLSKPTDLDSSLAPPP